MHISPNDHRKYRSITLPNALRVLLIEDAKAPRSAAALSAHVGHFSDPLDREGLAHFLEHMLFLGTEKYPCMGEFQTFITQHGGSNNAWTGLENTTYFFDIQSDFFQEALSRFGAFFSTPLFQHEAVEKERNAVESEYRLKIQDDVRRIYQVHKETVNPLHPFSKFSVGSKETLEEREGQSIRDDLIAFFKSHYSANLMTLALIGPHSLDTLEALTHEAFEEIPNRHLCPFVPTAPLVEKEQLQQFIRIEPIKDLRKLTLTFVLPDANPHYKIKPLSYIAHLLGDESTGSLISYLKSKEYANNLSAGGGNNGSNFREFSISLGLTKKGLSNIDDIVCAVFQSLHLIRKEGLSAWRYDEKRAVQEMAFRYQEPKRPIDTVSHLVLNMQHYEEEDLIYGDYMMQGYDEALIREQLNTLIPEHLRITLIAQGEKYNKKALWYDTPYSSTPFTDEQVQKWKDPYLSPALTLPKPNPYICYDIDPALITAPENTLPECIRTEPGFRLWHFQDPLFNLPKEVVYISIESPHAVSSVQHIVKTRVSVEMLLEAINETAYPAEIAGLSYNLYAHQGGATLKLSGFNEKLPLLLNVILDKFTQRDFKPARFNVIKTLLLRNWKNALKDKPINRLYNTLTGILQPNNPPYEALIEALENLEVSALPEFIELVLSNLYIDMFVYGNGQKEKAQALGNTVKQVFHLDKQNHQEPKRPLVLLENQGNASFHLPCQSADSAVVVYYQSQGRSPEEVALFTFAQHLVSAAFFTELRTKQQLGYMVGSGNMPLNRHPGLLFYVQSPFAGPAKLLDAIDDFLNAFYLLLLELNEKQWETSKHSLIAQIEEQETHFLSRAQRYWICIGNKDFDFSQRQKVAEALRHLERAEMVKFVVQKLKPRTSDRLIMQSCNAAHLGQRVQAQEITSVTAFRRHRLEYD